MIQSHNIRFTYGNNKRQVVLQDVSFTVEQGQLAIIMGPSGSGKTTLLRCLANVHTSYEGSINMNGKDLKQLTAKERATTVGFVLQQFHLFPHWTVLENCMQPLMKIVGLSREQAYMQATTHLIALDLQNLQHAYPRYLSGGQQQRVAIARALGLQPSILMFDEPTSALDPENKKRLETLLLDLKRQGMTLVISSHDMSFIKRLQDKIMFLEEGMLVEMYDSQQEELAAHSKIAQFISHH